MLGAGGALGFELKATPCLHRYDAGGDSFIDLMELKLMMEKLGAPQTHLGLKDMIREVDEDFDGKLSFREVSAVLPDRLPDAPRGVSSGALLVALGGPCAMPGLSGYVQAGAPTPAVSGSSKFCFLANPEEGPGCPAVPCRPAWGPCTARACL